MLTQAVMPSFSALTPSTAPVPPQFGIDYTDPLPLKMYTTRRFYEDRMSQSEFNDDTVRKYIDLSLLPKVKQEMQREAQQKMLRQMQEVYKNSPYANLLNQVPQGGMPAQYLPWMNLLKDPEALQRLQSLMAPQGQQSVPAVVPGQPTGPMPVMAPGLNRLA